MTALKLLSSPSSFSISLSVSESSFKAVSNTYSFARCKNCSTHTSLNAFVGKDDSSDDDDDEKDESTRF